MSASESPRTAGVQQLVRGVGATIYALAILLLTSAGVGAAARGGILIPIAAPFALVLIGALRVLRPSAERVAWALFTVWLGSTYLQTGAGPERVAFLVYTGAALGGIFVTPWLLVAAWALHPAWDLVPRSLPAVLHDLPVACLFFDGVVAIYLAWASYAGRWPARAGRGVQHATRHASPPTAT